MIKTHWWWLVPVVLVLLSYPMSSVIMYGDNQYESYAVDVLRANLQTVPVDKAIDIEHRDRQVLITADAPMFRTEIDVPHDAYMVMVVKPAPRRHKIEAHLYMFWSPIESQVAQWWATLKTGFR